MLISIDRFNGNIAELGGGAIYVTTNSNSSLVLGDGVTFNHNYAARGGAIYVEGSPDSIRPPFIAFPSHVTFDSNGASDYGPSIASSLDKLLANGTISALFSGEVLEHLSVAPVDVYGQYFVPSLADSLLLTISLPNGDVFGSVTQYRAQSFIDFRRIVVTANPGEHMRSSKLASL
ncbi:hypothetical protein DFS34DRAFT_199521 [Phlyctochytrium arcticum]|nr:hypothetical protein DFS34DRAFT_199521 [Phlyctochytrium arcticum]